jgi:hypothetical protein
LDQEHRRGQAAPRRRLRRHGMGELASRAAFTRTGAALNRLNGAARASAPSLLLARALALVEGFGLGFCSELTPCRGRAYCSAHRSGGPRGASADLMPASVGGHRGSRSPGQSIRRSLGFGGGRGLVSVLRRLLGCDRGAPSESERRAARIGHVCRALMICEVTARRSGVLGTLVADASGREVRTRQARSPRGVGPRSPRAPSRVIGRLGRVWCSAGQRASRRRLGGLRWRRLLGGMLAVLDVRGPDTDRARRG